MCEITIKLEREKRFSSENDKRQESILRLSHSQMEWNEGVLKERDD